MTEASRILGVTERTIRRYVKEGKYQSKLEDSRRYVLLDEEEDFPSDDGKLINQMQAEIEYLREELSQARQRSDTIIMQLTKQLERQTLVLEDMRNRSFWRRIKMAFIRFGSPVVTEQKGA
jgi:predicted site-specific integrase-resolvase